LSNAVSQLLWQARQPTARGWNPLADIAIPEAKTKAAAEKSTIFLSFITTLLVCPNRAGSGYARENGVVNAICEDHAHFCARWPTDGAPHSSV
jgi:hypothetical protein